jgi:bacterioferritin-associated ferredoxin
MIVCSCNIITRRDIEAVIERLLADDPYAVLTPNLIYHRLGRRGRCCGCFPQVSQILVEHATLVRERLAAGADAEGGSNAAEIAPFARAG